MINIIIIDDIKEFDKYILKKELNKVEVQISKSKMISMILIKWFIIIGGNVQIANINYFKDMSSLVLYYPTNFRKLLANTVIQYKLNNKSKSDLHPVDIIKGIKDVI